MIEIAPYRNPDHIRRLGMLALPLISYIRKTSLAIMVEHSVIEGVKNHEPFIPVPDYPTV